LVLALAPRRTLLWRLLMPLLQVLEKLLALLDKGFKVQLFLKLRALQAVSELRHPMRSHKARLPTHSHNLLLLWVWPLRHLWRLL
jgi:CBS domain containing-hemolysin-like protein